MSGMKRTDRFGPFIMKPATSEYSWRCGTRNGVMLILSFNWVAQSGARGLISIFLKRTSWLQGPFVFRKSAILGIACTGIFFVPIASRPKNIRPV